MLAMGAALNFSLRPLPYEGWDNVSYSTFIFPLRYISLIIQFLCTVAVYYESPSSNPVSYQYFHLVLGLPLFLLPSTHIHCLSFTSTPHNMTKPSHPRLLYLLTLVTLTVLLMISMSLLFMFAFSQFYSQYKVVIYDIKKYFFGERADELWRRGTVEDQLWKSACTKMASLECSEYRCVWNAVQFWMPCNKFIDINNTTVSWRRENEHQNIIFPGW